MLSELHNLNLKLCSKQYNKIDLLHLIAPPQLSGNRWQLLKQNKTGRPRKWDVCVFFYVYGLAK